MLVIWGTIIALGGILGILMLANQNARSLSSTDSPAANSSRIASKPTFHPTPGRTVIYLPSATARAATAMPVTPTLVFSSPLPIVKYSSTLPPDADPLTGLRPAILENLNRRPIAVKVSTFPRGAVRPVQSGLTRADQVYEYYIEDGLTRFIAVFYSQDAERAGPVRSGRYFDEYVMRMYHASLVFANADERVEKHLLDSDLLPLLFVPRPDNCPPLCRDTSILGYNNVFVNTAGVGSKLTDNSRQNLRAALFAPLLYPESLPAIDRIYTHYSIYSYNYWEYDPTSRVYKRYSDTVDATAFTQGEVYGPHIDNLTGAQLTADNVVVLFVPHIFHNEFDRADQVFDITINGTGQAYLFRDGRMVEGSWVRDQIDQPIQFQDKDGFAIPLKPGVTYYQVINPESSVNQTDTTMEFFFFTPLREVTSTPTPKGFVPSATPRKNQH